MNQEQEQILENASISISDTPERFLIKSKFNFLNKSNLGILFFLFASLFLLVIVILKGDEWLSIVIGSVFSGAMFIFSILVLLKQLTDFVEVTNEEIKFRNSLIIKTFRLQSGMKIKVDARTEYIKIRRLPGSGSYFRHNDLYLIHNNSEYRIFNFQVEDKYSKEANKLGSEISHKIKKRIETFNTL